MLPVLISFVVLSLSSTKGWSLPPCPGSPTEDVSTAMSWTNCFGTAITLNGDFKYVGEWKDGMFHGDGILTTDTGVWKGLFENGSFLYGKKTQR